MCVPVLLLDGCTRQEYVSIEADIKGVLQNYFISQCACEGSSLLKLVSSLKEMMEKRAMSFQS